MNVDDSRSADEALSAERRSLLRLKGQLLYGKYCHTRGHGVCAEGFCAFHLGNGTPEVVEDLVEFLRGQIALSKRGEPSERIAMTERLLARLEHMLSRARLGTQREVADEVLESLRRRQRSRMREEGR